MAQPDADIVQALVAGHPGEAVEGGQVERDGIAAQGLFALDVVVLPTSAISLQ